MEESVATEAEATSSREKGRALAARNHPAAREHHGDCEDTESSRKAQTQRTRQPSTQHAGCPSISASSSSSPPLLLLSSAASPPPATQLLLALNLLVFALQLLSRGRLLSLGAKLNSAIRAGQWWRLLSAALLHASLPHLAANCTSLLSIAPPVEAIFGAPRMLLIYTISAVSASLLSFLASPVPSVGASGAVLGLAGALASLLLRRLRASAAAGPLLKQLLLSLALSLCASALQQNVDHWGHTGGFLGGALAGWLLSASTAR